MSASVDLLAMVEESSKGFMTTCFEENGNVHLGVVLYSNYNPDTGELMPDNMAAIYIPCLIEKQAWAQKCREEAVSKKAVMAALISETWVAALPIGTLPDGPISQRPDRVEKLMLVIETIGESSPVVWSNTIQREIPGDEASPGSLLGWEMTETMGVGGLFAGLLPPTVEH